MVFIWYSEKIIDLWPGPDLIFDLWLGIIILIERKKWKSFIMNNRENLHHSNFRKCWHLWLKQKRWNSEFCENCEKVKLWKKWIFNFSQISSDDSGLGEIQNSEDEQTDSEVVILDDSGLKSDFALYHPSCYESYQMCHIIYGP